MSRPASPDPVRRSASRLRRRSVLTASLAGPGVLATVAACGDRAQSPPQSADTSADAGTSGASAATAGGSTDAGESVEAQLVPVGMAVYLEASNTVVTQPTEGDFHAFDATCPHQGCAVNQAVDGELKCPCHGSRFDLSTGDVLEGPAQSGLSEIAVRVEGDRVVVGQGR